MQSLKLIWIALPLVFLGSCSRAPECKFKGEYESEANAGCFVVRGNKALFVEGKNGKLSLPGGTKKSGEAPQCTAERETWEETGMQVISQTKVHSFENGFQLFDCNLLDSQRMDGSNRPLGLEIDAIHWLEADDFEGRAWRFPEQVERYKKQLRK